MPWKIYDAVEKKDVVDPNTGKDDFFFKSKAAALTYAEGLEGTYHRRAETLGIEINRRMIRYRIIPTRKKGIVAQ